MRKISTLPVLMMMLSLSACITLQAPVNTAESPEQKAFALYGTFVNIQEVAARHVTSGKATDSQIKLIQSADAIAYPLAVALKDAAFAYRDAKEGKLKQDAYIELERSFADASNSIHDMINLVVNLIEGN